MVLRIGGDETGVASGLALGWMFRNRLRHPSWSGRKSSARSASGGWVGAWVVAWQVEEA